MAKEVYYVQAVKSSGGWIVTKKITVEGKPPKYETVSKHGNLDDALKVVRKKNGK